MPHESLRTSPHSIFAIFLLSLSILTTLFFLQRDDATPIPPAHKTITLDLPANIDQSWQAGDLIFRAGSDLASNAVRAASQGSQYSHVGILLRHDAHWQVIHAVPAEIPNRNDAVVIDSLEFFVAPERARQIAVYRVTALPEERKHAIAHALERLGEPFRITKDETGKREGTYCTLLIWDAWRTSGVDLNVPFDQLAIPLAAGEYLLPSTLLTSQRLTLIYESPHPKGLV